MKKNFYRLEVTDINPLDRILNNEELTVVDVCLGTLEECIATSKTYELKEGCTFQITGFVYDDEVITWNGEQPYEMPKGSVKVDGVYFINDNGEFVRH